MICGDLTPRRQDAKDGELTGKKMKVAEKLRAAFPKPKHSLRRIIRNA
jgi:hypothetical protein